MLDLQIHFCMQSHAKISRQEFAYKNTDKSNAAVVVTLRLVSSPVDKLGISSQNIIFSNVYSLNQGKANQMLKT